MSDELPSRRSLDSLKKEAKRWLAALRTNAADARARLERAFPSAPAVPTLRDIQYAIAREHGFAGWTALKEAIQRALGAERDAGAKAVATYDTMAEALLDAYRTGTPEAMERLYRFTWHRRTWEGFRTYIQLDLGKRPAGPGDDVDITLDDARHLIAREHGFSNWEELKKFSEASSGKGKLAAKPVRLVNPGAAEGQQTVATSREWDEIIRLLAMHPSTILNAEGQMTDDVLADIASAPIAQSITAPDRGLEVLQNSPAMKSLSLWWTRITDEGVQHLAKCHDLERVNLGGTQTGDGALRVLAGKQKLHDLQSGAHVTDAGIPLLHELPVFKTWHGGEVKMALLSYDSAPNRLSLRGSFTDRGMQHMRGLDGLFGLNLDDSNLAISAAAMIPLVSLPNLGWLGVDAKDDWMPYVAEMPKLRFLAAQDTPAGDDGFVALSKSQSIEYIWGRRCHNLQRRGFMALANMPALRGLSVGCLNVDDVGVSALPSFPALRELMPMDVPDAGYRHIGQCGELESLILMYCRDTTDAATEHLTGLSKLSYYFNSYTTITDRTPALLSGINSLERITFDACHGLTNVGVSALARLPMLRELRVSGRQITPEVVGLFPPRINVYPGG
jgi:Leucine Rich repeat